MTILQAIKSGKPFRRRGWKVWLESVYPMAITIKGTATKERGSDTYACITYTTSRKGILAEDWEIKQ